MMVYTMNRENTYTSFQAVNRSMTYYSEVFYLLVYLIAHNYDFMAFTPRFTTA